MTTRDFFIVPDSELEWVWKAFEVIPGKTPYMLFLFFGDMHMAGVEYSQQMEAYDCPAGCPGIYLRPAGVDRAARVLVIYR
jgi:hypothetical protein